MGARLLVVSMTGELLGCDPMRQEGWLSPTERASVSAISLRHIISLPHESHTSVSIMSLPAAELRVEVCYMDDGKMIQCWSKHCSIYPSIFNRLRAIARYWSEIATFSYPLAFSAPVGGVPIGIPEKSLDLRKLELRDYQAMKTV